MGIFFDFIMIYLLIYVKWYSYCAYLIFFCNFNWKKKSRYNYLILKHKCILIRELTLGVCGCSFLNLCGGFSSSLKRIEINLTKHGGFFLFEKNSISLFKKCLVHFMLPGFIFLFVVFFCNNITLILFFSHKCKLTQTVF